MISRAQFYLLTVNYILGTTLFVLIFRMITHGGRDAWLVPLAGGAFGVLAALLWIGLHRCYPGKHPPQMFKEALGRPLGILVSALYFFFFVTLAAWMLRNLSDFMNMTMMRETPKTVFHLMFLLIVCYIAARGAETIGRMNAIVTPFLVIPFWLSLMLATINWNWERVQPMFQTPLIHLLNFTSIYGFPFMEAVALMMLYPLVRSGAGSALLFGIASAAVSLSMVVFAAIGLLGVERASRLNFPIYSIVQEVTLGETIVNIHSVLTVILLTLIFVKTMVLVYGAHEMLRQTFRPIRQWPLLLAIMIVISAAALMIYENPIQNGEWNRRYTFIYDGFFALFIPGLILAATWVRRAFRPGARRR